MTETHRAAVAIRAHRTVELLEDRLYKIECGHGGFTVREIYSKVEIERDL